MSDDLQRRRLLDLIHRAQKNWQAEWSDFIPREEAEDLLTLFAGTDLTVRTWGGWEGAERVRLAFSMLDDLTNDDFHLALMGLDGPAKFLKADHRDYLGALMSLGFTRDKMGDILVRESGCDFFIDRDLVDYLAVSDLRVRRVPVQIAQRDWQSWIPPEIKTEEQALIVPSLRLDAVLAKSFQLSRRLAADLIDAGLVRVNHTVEYRSHYLLASGDLLAVRGHGRVRIGSTTGATKKGNVKLLIERYL